jgi:hypothetical protein
MTFSDDHASPAAPFSGDETGQIFDAPDMVWQSPTTTERIVDTQSGFLVVIKYMKDRQSLSVKRRLGTPPASAVTLTPDESLKLSRILAGTAPPDRQPVSPEAEEWLNDFARNSGGAGLAYRAELARSKRNYKAISLGGVRGLPAVAILSAVLVLALAGFAVQTFKPMFKKPVAVPAAPVDPLNSKSVDRFARAFVSDLLDFDPDTYRISQIKAMAAMSPELVDTYWTDTHFPLSKRDLVRLPQGNTVMITRVAQNRLNADTTAVDVFGELITANSKVGNAVHLKLKVGLDRDSNLVIVEQQDATTVSK